ncbi:MAG: S41 family peptidase [Deltaproteobacteria bacterium]|jgi:carboxyl-terminal processing protease|nr:S41 family peptidase [Deltaproteobacteria bacterium]
MNHTKYRHIKLWLVVVISIVFWTLGTGFYGNLSADNKETYEGLKIFSDVIELIEKNYVEEVESKTLIEKAIQGMVQSLDPHSALLPPEAFEDLNIDTKGKFTGIGIHITMRDGFVTVISPIEGTPAYKAGITALDRIIKVDGKPVTDIREAVNMMRGPKGTPVTVSVQRQGVSELIEFNLIRDVIPIESVKASILKPGYGYIRITNFNSETTKDLKKALKELESGEDPFKGLILDFRDNGGGLLDQAIKVTDEFLDNGTILSIRGRHQRNTREFKAHPLEVSRDYPIVALINGGSASASEIVVGALQDHKRALVLGTTSFGKGSVQTIETLRDGYGLKLTIAQYYTPSGKSIQAKGIEPDIVVTRRFADEDGSEMEQNRLKEKDLKNHLEAEPDDRNPRKKESDNKEEKNKRINKQRLEFRIGPLSAENLRTDNQVMRALEILISYDIFEKKRG